MPKKKNPNVSVVYRGPKRLFVGVGEVSPGDVIEVSQAAAADHPELYEIPADVVGEQEGTK